MPRVKIQFCPKCQTEKPLVEFNDCCQGNSGYGNDTWCKACWRVYRQTPQRKAYWKVYRQTPQYKAYWKVYRQIPQHKERHNVFQRTYYKTPQCKAYYKAYYKVYGQTPEYKAKKKLYSQTPQYKARRQTPQYKAFQNSWHKDHQDLWNAAYKKYVCDKENQTPPWADLEAIKKFYTRAARLTKKTGVQYDVDHKIPLHGKNVSGLHVENNLQVITHTENMRKNRTWVP